jgi:hypothetical protein
MFSFEGIQVSVGDYRRRSRESNEIETGKKMVLIR